MIVGLCGKKGSGKDTAAAFAHAEFENARVESFARRLKDICMNVFGLDVSEVDGENKERLCAPVRIDDYLEQLSDATGLDIKPRRLIAVTPRQILQYVGSEYVRDVQDDYWVAYLMNKIERPGAGVTFITDCRFPNEAEAIRSRGGLLVLIERPGMNSVDNHPSEDTSALTPDFVLRNERGRQWLGESLAKLVKEAM